MNISSATASAREFLAKAATSTATNQPAVIPKNNVLVKDYSIEHNCRAALLRFFDEHDPDNLKNPISRRLLELIGSEDLDQQSKQELTKVFIHSPPARLTTTIKAKKLSEFKKPVNDPAELLKHRYLCKGGGLLLVGSTGLGKSSLAMQLAIKWALGQPCFGLEPARPIKSLIIQAENDEGDLGEMKDGVFNGLNLSMEDQAKAEDNIHIYSENAKVRSLVIKVAPLCIGKTRGRRVTARQQSLAPQIQTVPNSPLD